MTQTTNTALKVGMAAFGMSGKVFHAPLIHVHPHLELSVVYERNSEKSKAEYPYVKVVRSFEEMLQDESLELIVVNTPQHLHHDMCKKALLSGKHVVVEKPFTVTSAEARELITLAREKSKILAVFQNRRWDGDFLTVRKVIENKLLGGLVEYEAHYDRYRNYIENSWKEEDTLPGSGLLYNLGSHLIDQALCFFGLPESILADISIVRPGGKVVDFIKLILYYDNLKVELHSSYLVREPFPRFVLHGTLGSFVKYGIDPQEDDLKSGKKPLIPLWGTDKRDNWGKLNTEIDGLHFEGLIETIPGNYMKFYENVYEAIRFGEELAVNPKDPLHGIKIIEAAIESSRTKNRVRLDFSS